MKFRAYFFVWVFAQVINFAWPGSCRPCMMASRTMELRDPRACSTKKARPLDKGERAGFLVTVRLIPGLRVGAYQWGGVFCKHPLSFRPSAVTVW